MAKFLYNKPRKIVCEMRSGDSLVKIDILWSKIRAMSACFDDPRFDTLRIEVRYTQNPIFLNPALFVY